MEATLEIPEGAFDGPAAVTATSSEPVKIPGRVAVGRLWDVRVNGAEHAEFRQPVLIRVPYDVSKVPPGMRVLLMTDVGGRWRPLASSRTDAAAGCVTAAVTHLSGHQPVLMDEDIRLVARWYGQHTNTLDRFPGIFGPPNGTDSGSQIRRTLFIVAREDVLLYPTGGEARRFVVESAGVSIKLNKVTGITKDKRKLIFRDAMNESVSMSEEELTRHDAEFDGKIDAEAAKLEELELELARAVAAQAGAADPKEAAALVKDLQERVSAQKMQVRTMEFNSVFSDCRLTASLQNGTWYVSANVADDRFKYTHRAYEVGFNLQGGGMPWEQGGPRVEDISLGQSFDAEGNAGGRIQKNAEYSGSHGNSVETTTFTRVMADSPGPAREIRIAGNVLHRIHVPKDADNDNWIGASPGQTWQDLGALAIPVAGKCLLEAFLVDPGDGLETPVNSCVTADDGTFDFKVPLAPLKTLRLRLTWENRDAQIKERCDLDVSLGQAVTAAESIPGTGSAPVGGIPRKTKAWLRYRKAPLEFDLGAEDRGASVTKDPHGAVTLEFRELNSLLVNSFVRKANHLNQNQNTFFVRVNPRIDEALARCPATLREEVNARLAMDVTDGTTAATFAGNEVCYPSSTLMALDSLGLETIVLDAAGKTDQLGDLAQAVYDKAVELLESTNADLKVTWIDVPVTQADADRLDRLVATGQTAEAKRLRDQIQKTWPYGPDEGRSKHWLLTVQAPSGNRPWQVAKWMNAALRDRYPGISSEMAVNGALDPFSDRGAGDQLISNLGKGGSGVVSISHLSGRHDDPDKDGIRQFISETGGHLLCHLGVVMRSDGTIARVVVHDPYGDLTRNPDYNGYYDTRDWNPGPPDDVQDVDKTGHFGGWAPYGPAPNPVCAFGDTIAGKYIVFMRASSAAPTPASVRERLVPGVR